MTVYKGVTVLDKQMTTADESFKQKAKKRKRKKRLLILKIFLLLVLLGTTIVLVAFSPLFNIKTIKVKGNQHYKEDDIAVVTSLYPGLNGFKSIGNSFTGFFLLRYGQEETKLIKSLPYLKSAIVKYIPPSSIQITVIERKPMGIAAYMGAVLVIDREGYVIDILNKGQARDLPEINGLKYDRYELGSRLVTSVPDAVKNVAILLDTIMDSDENGELKLYPIVNSVNVEGKISIFVDSRIKVNIGDLRDLNYKISYLKQILLKGIKKEEKGLLDFTSGQNPNFIPEK